MYLWIFQGGSAVKESACNSGDASSISGLGRSLEKEVETHSSGKPISSGKSQGKKSLEGYSPWGHRKS